MLIRDDQSIRNIQIVNEIIGNHINNTNSAISTENSDSKWLKEQCIL